MKDNSFNKTFLITLLSSFIYNFLFNTIALFDRVSLLYSYKSYLIGLIVTFFLNTSIFSFLFLSRWLTIIFIPFIFIISAIITYFIYFFKVPISMNIIALAFETSFEEASGFIGGVFVSWLTTAFLISCLIVFLRFKFEKEINKKILLVILICSLPVYFTIKHFDPKKRKKEYLPEKLIERTYKYFLYKKRFISLIKNKKEIPLKILKDNTLDNFTIVFIIGESARADHFYLNGYKRNTNPLLSHISSLVSFTNFHSCGNNTRRSVPFMLTNAKCGDWDKANNEKSVISLFNKLGYFTAWISNQRKFTNVDNEITAIAKESKYVYFNNKSGEVTQKKIYDEELLPYLDRVLANNYRKKFIVLHTIGSHWVYDNHYPKKFRKFQPVCNKKLPMKCEQQALINSYDNSILYTDYFIYQIIKRLNKKNSIIIYSSDHAESLGENGLYAHGQRNAKEQFWIGTLIWFSEKILSQETFNKKLNNSKILKNRYLNHRYLFHSLLDCSGIKSDIIDKDLSFCND